MSKKDFRNIFFYEFKLGRNATETARNINTVWGQGSIDDSTVRRWFTKFREGETSLEDQEGRGRPSAVDDAILKTMVEDSPRVTIKELAQQLQVDPATISRHLNLIGKVKKLDKWIPHELSEKQKTHRFELCSMHLLRYKTDPFLERIITCDEKWVLYDNRKRSGQWLDKTEPPKHFPKPDLHPKKIMLTVWWSTQGLIHHEFLNPNETITGERYCQLIDKMHEKLSHIYPALVNRKGPILLHDNARPHASRMTFQKLLALGYETLPLPPYSPDLSPTDFYFFKHLSKFLEDRVFKNQTDAQSAFKEFLGSRTSDFYETGIKKLISRWEKCVSSNGSYFD